MIELKIRLTGEGEKSFNDIMSQVTVGEEDIVADAFALIYLAIREAKNGKSVGVFDKEKREFTPVTTRTLSSLKA